MVIMEEYVNNYVNMRSNSLVYVYQKLHTTGNTHMIQDIQCNMKLWANNDDI